MNTLWKGIDPKNPYLTGNRNSRWAWDAITNDYEYSFVKALFGIHPIHPYISYESILGIPIVDLRRSAYSQRTKISQTNKWKMKPEFTFKELWGASFPQPFRLSCVRSSRFANALCKYHPKVFFILMGRNPAFLDYTDSIEDAWFAANSEFLMVGDHPPP